MDFKEAYNHDIYRRGENEFETVERHKEIPEILAQAILKRGLSRKRVKLYYPTLI